MCACLQSTWTGPVVADEEVLLLRQRLAAVEQEAAAERSALAARAVSATCAPQDSPGSSSNACCQVYALISAPPGALVLVYMCPHASIYVSSC